MSYRRSFEFIPPFLLYLYVIVLFQGHWTKAVAISNNKHESHKVALFSSITTIQSSHYQHIQSENKLATELKLPKPYCVIKTCQDRPAIPPVSETRNSVIQEEPQDPETIAYDEESSVAQLAQRLQYQRNTQGIVTMASASAVPVLIVWLHMLRGSGTRLPVEVFFPSWSRRDEFIWGRSLRPFNVRCRSLNVNPATTLDQAPLVASAMLFSSFENVLFLKLDTFPTTDAGKLFASDQYISNGLLALPVEYLDAAPLRLDVLMLNKTTRAEPVTRLAYHKTFSPQWDCPLQCSSSGSQEPTQHDDTFLPTSLGASFHREEVTLISQPESSGISRIRLHSCGKSGMETVFVQLKIK
ncbi:mannosyltransferase putative-domain-containing protein [Dendryphion nanum]|uniref:Mannosyltransferase putative-domain-containing protein n=1 Tax=Dendryphion nanum TaxID=256645 RepID=A0A9P9EEN8_9PLEO|nr:mannosyltransferase putative-domain-containing protein [Dendryphion nanum]